MQNKIEEKIEIPNGIKVEINRTLIQVTGPKGSLERRFSNPKVSITKEGNTICFRTESSRRNEKRILNTFLSHINNIIKGVTDGFQYKLKICSGHFPISVTVKGKTVEISNFLGEKIPRKAQIPDGVDVKVNGDNVLVESIDLEKAGMTASRIEQATRITNRDRRIFQDGCYIVEKPGVIYG